LRERRNLFVEANMTAETEIPKKAGRNEKRTALCVTLASGPASIALDRVHRVVGYATLSGEPDTYFLGWLVFQGRDVPVFDLNRVLCEQPTPEAFGSRIMLIIAAPNAPLPHIGLLAAGVTNTIPIGAATRENDGLLDLDSFLPMLYTLTPQRVAITAA
jgi:chemotaxis signal transduction protein